MGIVEPPINPATPNPAKKLINGMCVYLQKYFNSVDLVAIIPKPLPRYSNIAPPSTRKFYLQSGNSPIPVILPRNPKGAHVKKLGAMPNTNLY